MERRPIPGYPRYEIDTTGIVWSYAVRGGGAAGQKMRLKEPRRKAQQLTTYGYYSVTLADGRGGERPWHVHRLVLLAFRGEPPHQGAHARHLNGNKTDNRLGNLAWGSAQDNVDDSRRLGWHMNAGSRNGRSRLTAADVRAIRSAVSSGDSRASVAARHGISTGHLCNIIARKVWRSVH